MGRSSESGWNSFILKRVQFICGRSPVTNLPPLDAEIRCSISCQCCVVYWAVQPVITLTSCFKKEIQFLSIPNQTATKKKNYLGTIFNARNFLPRHFSSEPSFSSLKLPVQFKRRSEKRQHSTRLVGLPRWPPIDDWFKQLNLGSRLHLVNVYENIFGRMKSG